MAGAGAATSGLGASGAGGLCAGGIFGAAAAFLSESNDLPCRTEITARLRQVRKNKIESAVVIRERKTLVLVPNIDSTPEKLSTRPLPLPLWIKTKQINPIQIVTCTIIKSVVIS